MSLFRAIQSLGAVAGKSIRPSKSARSVIDAFARGEPAEGSCHPVKGKGRVCDISTDGLELTVKGSTVASRERPWSAMITVCPGAAGQGEAARKAANEMLRLLKTGINVKDVGEGSERDSRLVGRKGRARVVAPQCVRIELPRRVRAAAERAEDSGLRKAILDEPGARQGDAKWLADVAGAKGRKTKGREKVLADIKRQVVQRRKERAEKIAALRSGKKIK